MPKVTQPVSVKRQDSNLGLPVSKSPPLATGSRAAYQIDEFRKQAISLARNSSAGDNDERDFYSGPNVCSHEALVLACHVYRDPCMANPRPWIGGWISATSRLTSSVVLIWKRAADLNPVRTINFQGAGRKIPFCLESAIEMWTITTMTSLGTLVIADWKSFLY